MRRPLLITSLAVLGATGAAWADVGVGVGASPIVLPSPARAGHRYDLTPLYVVNTGTRRTTYTVTVRRLARVPGTRLVPAGWVKVSRPTVTLGAKRSTSIKLKLAVSRRAHAGRYATDLVVSSVATGAGTSAGAGAATRLQFEVAKPRRKN